MNFDFKNEWKNEFQDKNEKLCSLFKNTTPQKIDLIAGGTQKSHPTAWELKKENVFRFSCVVNESPPDLPY